MMRKLLKILKPNLILDSSQRYGFYKRSLRITALPWLEVVVDWWRSRWSHAGNYKQDDGYKAIGELIYRYCTYFLQCWNENFIYLFNIKRGKLKLLNYRNHWNRDLRRRVLDSINAPSSWVLLCQKNKRGCVLNFYQKIKSQTS